MSISISVTITRDLLFGDDRPEYENIAIDASIKSFMRDVGSNIAVLYREAEITVNESDVAMIGVELPSDGDMLAVRRAIVQDNVQLILESTWRSLAWLVFKGEQEDTHG